MSEPRTFTYDLRSWSATGDPVASVDGLTYGAARHVAEIHASLGEQVRIFAREADYVESWYRDPEPGFRAGTFAATTMVRVREDPDDTIDAQYEATVLEVCEHGHPPHDAGAGCGPCTDATLAGGGS